PTEGERRLCGRRQGGDCATQPGQELEIPLVGRDEAIEERAVVRTLEEHRAVLGPDGARLRDACLPGQCRNEDEEGGGDNRDEEHPVVAGDRCIPPRIRPTGSRRVAFLAWRRHGSRLAHPARAPVPDPTAKLTRSNLPRGT